MREAVHSGDRRRNGWRPCSGVKIGSRGHAIMLFDINAGTLEVVAARLGDDRRFFAESVADGTACKQAVETMAQDFGDLDGVSHNTGKSCGDMVLTASVQGMAMQAGALAYVAAKHGLVGLVVGMAMDEAARGVRINGEPGSVDTPMLGDAIALDPSPKQLGQAIDAMHPLGRRAEPFEVANAVGFSCRSGFNHDRRSGAAGWRGASGDRWRVPDRPSARRKRGRLSAYACKNSVAPYLQLQPSCFRIIYIMELFDVGNS